MKTLEGGHKDEERGTGRASGAGVAMLQKDMPGGRQVKERRTASIRSCLSLTPTSFGSREASECPLLPLLQGQQ